MFAFSSTFIRILSQDIDLLVSVPLLLAAMVCCVIIGYQYIPSFHFFVGPSKCEL